MQRCASAAQRRIEHAAGGTPDLRIIGVGLQLHFLHSFDL